MKQSLTFRFIASLLICCLSAGTSFGQNTFQKTYSRPIYYYNDYANHIIATAGGYVMAGGEAFLMKVSPFGDVLWQKAYDLPQSGVEDLYHVVEANDGGFLAIGESNWIDDGGYLLLVKTDAEGNVQWQKRLGEPGWWQPARIGYYILPVPGGYVISGGSYVEEDPDYEDAIMLRIDNDGNIIWAQQYSNSPADTRLVAQFVRGDTLFASGHRDTSAVFAMINAETGNLMWLQAFDGPSLHEKSLDFMAPAANGDFMLAGHVYTPINGPRMQWVCRVSSTGELRWSKTYPNVGAGPIVPLSDDNFLLTPSGVKIFQLNQLESTLLKINSDGEVLWSYKYGKTVPDPDYFVSALETSDGGILAMGWIRTPNILQTAGDILLVKTDKNGRVEGCCRQPVSTTAMPYQIVIYPPSLNQISYLDTFRISVFETSIPERSMQDYCPAGPPEQLSSEVFICPGDSVLIGGIAYSAPGTVIDTLPGPSCDTVVTYTIQYTDLSGASVVNVQCPADKVVQVPAGTSSAVVDYDLPSAQSDCVCPDIELVQTQGLPSGSTFAVGVHNICYQGQDNCGNSSECCFQVSVVEDESACDVKTNGCTTFELVRITRDAAWRRTYHIRVTNNCPQPLVYAAFQVPTGVAAYAPANNATYTAPSGRPYKVRNPNYSPFYSVRFSSQNAGIQNGASDVFRYTLPPQSAPDYILSIVKRGDQTYTQAHLNTFYCPVEFDAQPWRAGEERNLGRAVTDNAMHLYPNPSNGVLFADLEATTGQALQIRIFDAQGNLVYEQHTEAGEQSLRIDLPANIVSGLYQFEMTDAGGERAVKRFMVR